MVATMARTSRFVAPGHPHHVTQRGNQRNRVFFGDDDYRLYLSILTEQARVGGCEVWCYCLMPNHVHLILRPDSEAALARTVGETHRRYTTLINGRNKTTGYLWQGRFWSAALDERYLLDAARYVLNNPVDGNKIKHPTAWPWSSARAHASSKSDGVVAVEPLAQRIGPFEQFMRTEVDPGAKERHETAVRRGWPIGDKTFIADLETMLGRKAEPRERGRPRQS
ncbi:transposase [Bradyrhizobium sp. 131]|uniref:transposase n=1 Tax=Bradyrhizobium sp. 131 TaxID=2782609 RepID=UPI001FFF2287|nr:transposase [Bradyrhizobium sp. 131]